MTITRRFAQASLTATAIVAFAASSKARAQGSAHGPARPGPAAPQEFKFPQVRSHTLRNGVQVYVIEDHSAQVVSVRAVFGVDSTFDPPGKEGLYQVTFGALREGTTSRTPAQLADASARIGTAVAPTGFTTVPVTFGPALALMGDMLMHPSFEPSAVDRRKAVTQSAFRARTRAPLHRRARCCTRFWMAATIRSRVRSTPPKPASARSRAMTWPVSTRRTLARRRCRS